MLRLTQYLPNLATEIRTRTSDIHISDESEDYLEIPVSTSFTE